MFKSFLDFQLMRNLAMIRATGSIRDLSFSISISVRWPNKQSKGWQNSKQVDKSSQSFCQKFCTVVQSLKCMKAVVYSVPSAVKACCACLFGPDPFGTSCLLCNELWRILHCTSCMLTFMVILNVFLTKTRCFCRKQDRSPILKWVKKLQYLCLMKIGSF